VFASVGRCDAPSGFADIAATIGEQILAADWTVREIWSIFEASNPWPLGSPKLGIPWVRMHAAKVESRALRCASAWGLRSAASIDADDGTAAGG